MATLFISVWADASQTLNGSPVQEMTVAIGGVSAQSAAISTDNVKELRLVRLFADADCFVAWGDNPTAVNDGSSGMPMGAENPEIVRIESGQKIAVIERV